MAGKKKDKAPATSKWVRVSVDQTKDSKRAIGLLRGAGFYVVSIPVNGRSGPEVRVGSDVYRGLSEIRKVAADKSATARGN